MVVYACNFSPKVEALGQKLKVSLGYIVQSQPVIGETLSEKQRKRNSTLSELFTSQETFQGFSNTA